MLGDLFRAMFDDFESDTHNLDFKIEQRATERHLKELNASGFRDGHQKWMENEALMQSGFDRAYKLFYKLAFLTGKIKALSLQSNPLKNDNVFQVKISEKLQSIEKFNYSSLIKWKLLITYNTHDEHNVEPNFDELENLINYYQTQLSMLNKSILAYNVSKSSNELANLNSILENFNVMSIQTNEQKQESDELNTIIENLNIKN